MKIFNKFIWSKKEPSNKNDIWFDGSTWRIYTEEAWQSFTLPVDAADKVAKVIENVSEVYQEKLNAGKGIVIKGNTISVDDSIKYDDSDVWEVIEILQQNKVEQTQLNDYVSLDRYVSTSQMLIDTIGELDSNKADKDKTEQELNKKLNKTDVATINGQSLVGTGDIKIEGKNYDTQLAEQSAKLTELSAEINGVVQSSITTEGWTLVPLDKPIPQGATITEVVVENGTMPSDIYVQTSQGTDRSFKVSELPLLLTYDIAKMTIGNVRGAKVTLTWGSPEGGISKQISGLSEAVDEYEAEISKVSDEIAIISAPVNIHSLVIQGEYYAADGTVAVSENYNRLKLIEVFSDKILLKNFNVYNASIRFLARDKSVLSTYSISPSDTEVTLPQGCKYIGVYYLNNEMLPFSAAIIDSSSYMATLSEGASNGGSDIDDDTIFIDLTTPNLFNPNDAEVLTNTYINQNNQVASNDYNTSGYISVKDNTTYYCAKGDVAQFRFINFYNADKVYLSGISVLSKSFTTPTNCAYVRVSVYSYSHAYPYAQVAEEYTDYIPYDTSIGIEPSIIADKRKVANIQDTGNILYGKKWAVVGDSFTAEFTAPQEGWTIEDGRYHGKSKVYGYIIGNRNNMTLQWLGKGGKTIATPASGGFTNAFSLEEYKNIDSDVDYITIYLGINDSHHAPGSTGDDGEDKTGEIPLGTIDDTTNATFYGAWNVVIPYLLEKHPFAHIGIIVSNGCDTDEYRVAEIAIAKKYGIPYIDLNGDERTPFMIRSTNSNIPSNVRLARTHVQAIDPDGVSGAVNLHPNKDAHEFQASFIETWMRSL